MSNDWFDSRRQDTFFEFLRIPSIATDPAFSKPTKECADFVISYLEEIGMDLEVWETTGQPVIFAQIGNGNGPTLLLYHHYDVQPADSSDFEPQMRDGQVYARGAQDNKGQCFYTLEALRTFLKDHPQPNFQIKLFIEGEEESGSEGTREVFATHKDALKADFLLVVDGGIPAPDTPAITLGMRGIVTAEVRTKGSNVDLHSGSFGGIAYNPLRALSIALASLWDETGRVAIPNFYDDVLAVEKEGVYFDLDETHLKKEIGMHAYWPEPGYSLGESGTIRPTVEINGIIGGYTGEGFKTVIPAEASAKVSCRLVAKQDATQIAQSLKDHLLKHLPQEMENTVLITSASNASQCDPESPIARVVANAYEGVENNPCKKAYGGGSIPIMGELAEAASAEALVMGWGLDTDGIHSPNEHFGIDRLEKGYVTMLNIFQEFHEKAT